MKRYLGYFIVFLVGFGVAIAISKKNIQTVVEEEIPETMSQFKAIIEETITREYQPRPPTMGRIFSSDHRWVEKLAKDRIRVILATGDVALSRSVNKKNVNKNDFTWPFEKTAEVLSQSDLTLINLETPLVSDCPETDEGMIFCGDPKNVEGLKIAGVDVVNLANNHASNFGLVGLTETKDVLKESNIEVTGVDGNLVVRNIRGIKFGFLGYNDISKPQMGVVNVGEDRIKKEIKEAKKLAEVVVVSFHWGDEYQEVPNERQKMLGHLAIGAGADLVIGNHPHWIEPVEIYKGKVIAYSHGNFIFDQDWSQKTKEGVVGKYTFYDDVLIDAEFLPVEIRDFGQPVWLTGERGEVVVRGMRGK
jgi:poly-gamma-glutamate synthesis protein (capsule biosynthesis protein)